MIESNQSKGVVDVETEDESAHKIGCLKIDDSIKDYNTLIGTFFLIYSKILS